MNNSLKQRKLFSSKLGLSLVAGCLMWLVILADTGRHIQQTSGKVIIAHFGGLHLAQFLKTSGPSGYTVHIRILSGTIIFLSGWLCFGGLVGIQSINRENTRPVSTSREKDSS